MTQTEVQTQTCCVKMRDQGNMPCGAAVEYLRAGQRGNFYSGWAHVDTALTTGQGGHLAVPKSWVG